MVRGYKLGLLTTADYNNLCQCETLEDIKLYLVGAAWGDARGRPLMPPKGAALASLLMCQIKALPLGVASRRFSLSPTRGSPACAALCSSLQTGTDYGPFLANEPSPMHTTTLVDCCTRKLVADWRYLRENVGAWPGGRLLLVHHGKV